MRQHVDENGNRIDPIDLPRGDGCLEPHVRRRITRGLDHFAPHGFRIPPDVSRRPHAPSSERRFGVPQQGLKERVVQRIGADERPERADAYFQGQLLVQDHLLQLGPGLGVAALAQEPHDCRAVVVVRRRFQTRQKGVVGLFCEVESPDARRLLVADAIQPPLESIDPPRIAFGVLVAVIAVVPVEDVQTPVGSRLLRDGHEPGVVCGQEVGCRLGRVRRTFARQDVDIHAAAVDVAHVELRAVLGRIGVAVKIMQAGIGGFLVLVVDNRTDFPSEGGIRPSLPVVIARLDQMPKMVDHARTDKCAAEVVPGDAPRVARPLAEELKLARPRVNAEHGTGELEIFVPCPHVALIKHSVEAVEPPVRPPVQRVGQFVRVASPKAGDDDLPPVSSSIAVGVLQEKKIRRVGDPYSAMPDRDSRRNVQALGKDRELVSLPIAVGVLQDLDPVPAHSGRLPRILETLRDPNAPALIEGHCDRVDDIRLRSN